MDFLFRKEEMSAPNIDFLMELWAFKAAKYEEDSPFKSHRDVYATINVICVGDVPWQCFSISPQYDIDLDVPWWQQTEYQVWYQDPDTVIQAMLANPDFDEQFGCAPYVHYDQAGKWCWKDFMSGNYAWHKAVSILAFNLHNYLTDFGTCRTQYTRMTHQRKDPCMSESSLDLLTLYFSADRRYDNDIQFWTFKRQLYHSSLAAILKSLEGPMTTPIVCWCPDGHFHRVIYDLAAFIANYPEQVMLAGIVQNWCVK